MQRKTLLVTGGNRGIGAAIVQAFQTKGWKVAACSSSDQSPWHSAPDLKFTCDVTQMSQIKKMMASIKSTWGALNCIVNNAGVAGTNSLEESADDETWDKILKTNLHGTYLITKSSLPLLKDGDASVIQISSVLGLQGVPDATAYCAAKHGVIGFSRALAHALAPRKITVNTVCPGWTRTDMAVERMKEIGLTESMLAKSVPLGKMIEPSEVAELCYFIASENARGITGKEFTIDGGMLP